MASFNIPIMQINLHQSISASATLTRSMSVVQTCTATLQEPWLVKGIIRGLGNCSKVLKANTASIIRTCIITKGVNTTGNLMIVHLRLTLADGIVRNMTVGSAYMPYDSEDLPPQEEIRD
jgi:hypothetical protein